MTAAELEAELARLRTAILRAIELCDAEKPYDAADVLRAALAWPEKL
jgi:hypothetical protein